MGEYTENFITDLRKAARVVQGLKDEKAVLLEELAVRQREAEEASDRIDGMNRKVDDYMDLTVASQLIRAIEAEVAKIDYWLGKGEVDGL